MGVWVTASFTSTGSVGVWVTPSVWVTASFISIGRSPRTCLQCRLFTDSLSHVRFNLLCSNSLISASLGTFLLNQLHMHLHLEKTGYVN